MAQFPGATQFPVRWWGFPTIRAPRRIKPTILLVVHQTGNSRLPEAMAEATYSNRDESGASFTFVLDRNGDVVQCLDPVSQTPWTNGDINQPNRSIPTVDAMVGSGFSPNEFCFATAENVAYDVLPDRRAPITNAQVESLAQIVAWGHKLTGLPIRRSTVIGHGDINSVSRRHCPTAGNRDEFLGGIIARAKEIASEGEEDPAVIEELRAKLRDCEERNQLKWRRIQKLLALRDTLTAEVDTLEAEVAAAADAMGTIAELRIRVRSLRTRIEGIKAKIAAEALADAEFAADIADD